MNQQKVANQLEAVLDEEIAARGRTTAVLHEQIEALRQKDREAFCECTQTLERELSSNSERGQRRARIVATLAAAWGVAPTALTVSSIATRLGAAGARISGKRAALREALASEFKANRRLGALMRAERRIVRDLLRSIYGDEVEQALDGAGNLMDAEA
jgi:hypothetical protein